MRTARLPTLRWVLVVAVAILVSCGGGSSSTTSDASSTSTVAGTDALQGDGSSSTQISPVVDCKVENVSIDPLTPTLWDAAGYCWGADRKVIVDIIIEMNPQMDPMNLRWNQIIKLPHGNSRIKACCGYAVGDTGPGGGIIVFKDEAGFDNSSGDPTSIGAMCLKVTCHYLEMAPTDLAGKFSWLGALNSSTTFSTPSANDWFLPSKDALNEMCKYAFGDTVNSVCNKSGVGGLLNSVGGFSDFYYWSTDEKVEGIDRYALWQSFSDGSRGYSYTSDDKTSYVRLVRTF